MTDPERQRVEAAFRSLPAFPGTCDTVDVHHNTYRFAFSTRTGESDTWTGCVENGLLAQPYAEAVASLGL